MESRLSPVQLLQFYVDAGVDEVILDQPLNRFALLEKNTPETTNVIDISSKPPLPNIVLEPAAAAPVTASEPATLEAMQDARALAAGAKTLEDLRAALEKFQGLTIRRSARNMVFADGVAESKIMVIGEAPGEDEDRLGRPFVGVSGQLLDKMLGAIGLNRDSNVYITNILNWRPPGNRAPSDAEIALSLPFIQRHIEIVQPRVIILAGGVAAKALLETNAGITRLRGKFVDFSLPGLPAPVPLMPIFHPAYLLRSPQHKALAWADLLAIKKRLTSVV
jgi:DNA polymerase